MKVIALVLLLLVALGDGRLCALRVSSWVLVASHAVRASGADVRTAPSVLLSRQMQ